MTIHSSNFITGSTNSDSGTGGEDEGCDTPIMLSGPAPDFTNKASVNMSKMRAHEPSSNLTGCADGSGSDASQGQSGLVRDSFGLILLKRVAVEELGLRVCLMNVSSALCFAGEPPRIN